MDKKDAADESRHLWENIPCERSPGGGGQVRLPQALAARLTALSPAVAVIGPHQAMVVTPEQDYEQLHTSLSEAESRGVVSVGEVRALVANACDCSVAGDTFPLPKWFLGMCGKQPDAMTVFSEARCVLMWESDRFPGTAKAADIAHRYNTITASETES